MREEARSNSYYTGIDAAPHKGGSDDTGSEKAQHSNHKTQCTLSHGTIPWLTTDSNDTPQSMFSGHGVPAVNHCQYIGRSSPAKPVNQPLRVF
jgi:hypothetical protein